MARGQGRNPFATSNGGRQATNGDARSSLGGGFALLLTLVASVAVMALHAAREPAVAQNAKKQFTQKDVADQAAKAEAAVARCDSANARKQLDRLKKTKEGLDTAAKSNLVQGAADDAKLLEETIKGLEEFLESV